MSGSLSTIIKLATNHHHPSQSYLLSIRPFLHPIPRKNDEHGALSSDGSEARHDVEGEHSNTLTTSTNEDAVFHWGREVRVDWGQAAWVTFRDQVSRTSFHRDIISI